VTVANINTTVSVLGRGNGRGCIDASYPCSTTMK
jgi:hypothetical protein